MIFFDSYAILELLRGNPSYTKYKNFALVTNTLNLSEVFYSLLKSEGKLIAEQMLENLNMEFIEISEDIAIESSKFKYLNRKKKLSYADCIGYTTARKLGFKFLTGDKQFKRMKGVEFVK